MCVCMRQISQHPLNMTILLPEKNSRVIFKYVSWGLAVGSLKLRVKTRGHKVPTLSTRETTWKVNDITNQRICHCSSADLYYLSQMVNNPGLFQIDLKR